MNPALSIAFVGAAYLMGCVTAAYYLVRWRSREDIRERHSGTVGATNAGRVLGPAGFVVTFLFDFAKGAVVVWSALHFFPERFVAAAAMLAVVVGHIWPLQLGFHGGKGMSAAMGGLAVFAPWTLLAVVVLTGLLCALIRVFKPASLLAVVLTPLASATLRPALSEWVATSLLAALVLWAHRRDLVDEWRKFRMRVPFEQGIKQ